MLFYRSRALMVSIFVACSPVLDVLRRKKDEPNQSQIMAGGNLLYNYPGNTSTDTAGLKLIKMHWKAVLFTENAKYMTINI